MRLSGWILVAIMAAVLVVVGSSRTFAQSATSDEQAAKKDPISAAEWKMKRKANEGLVRILGDSLDSTAFRAATDLAQALDDVEGFRLMPVVGKGSLSNVADLLYLKNVDLAIVQEDVLEQVRTERLHDAIERRVAYIAKLFDEEVHILARREITELSQLAGKKVSIGPDGSGSSVTAQAIFQKLGIEVQPMVISADQALLDLEAGTIDAMVYVDGKPSKLIERIPPQAASKLHLLPVPYDNALVTSYTPGTLSASDYPSLIAEGQKIDTVATGAILVVFNWKPDTSRHKNTTLFINAMFSRFDRLLRSPAHPKWNELNLSTRLANWTRFAPAEEALRTLPPRRLEVCNPQMLRAALEDYFRAMNVRIAGRTLSETESEAMLERFGEWLKNNPQQ